MKTGKTKKQVEAEFREKVGKSNPNLWGGRKPRLTSDEKKQFNTIWERQKNVNRAYHQHAMKVWAKPLKKLPPMEDLSSDLWG